MRHVRQRDQAEPTQWGKYARWTRGTPRLPVRVPFRGPPKAWGHPTKPGSPWGWWREVCLWSSPCCAAGSEDEAVSHTAGVPLPGRERGDGTGSAVTTGCRRTNAPWQDRAGRHAEGGAQGTGGGRRARGGAAGRPEGGGVWHDGAGVGVGAQHDDGAGVGVGGQHDGAGVGVGAQHDDGAGVGGTGAAWWRAAQLTPSTQREAQGSTRRGSKAILRIFFF